MVDMSDGEWEFIDGRSRTAFVEGLMECEACETAAIFGLGGMGVRLLSCHEGFLATHACCAAIISTKS